MSLSLGFLNLEKKIRERVVLGTGREGALKTEKECLLVLLDGCAWL